MISPVDFGYNFKCYQYYQGVNTFRISPSFILSFFVSVCVSLSLFCLLLVKLITIYYSKVWHI